MTRTADRDIAARLDRIERLLAEVLARREAGSNSGVKQCVTAEEIPAGWLHLKAAARTSGLSYHVVRRAALRLGEPFARRDAEGRIVVDVRLLQAFAASRRPQNDLRFAQTAVRDKRRGRPVVSADGRGHRHERRRRVEE